MATITARASLTDVLSAVQTQLALATGLPADRILPIARPGQRVPKLTADQDVLLRFRSFRKEGAINDFRGRQDLRLRHRLEVTIRTRFEMDSEDKDTRWLTDAGKGNIVAWQTVLDCLHGFVPTDSQGNVLVVEPFTVLEGATEKNSKDSGWGETLLAFGVLLEAPLTQRQANSTGWLAQVL